MDENVNKHNRSLELCRRVVTTESFIAEAKEIYGDLYDYSKVNYINGNHRVTVTCPVHGDFDIYAREHLDGKRCPKCEKGEKFIAKLKEKFGDKFGLEKLVYVDSTTPITLNCSIHGEFSRVPNTILSAPCGCPACGKDLLHEKNERLKEERRKIKEEKERLRIIAEEKEAKEKWESRIRSVVSDEKTDLVWYEDYFGFNLKNFTLDSGHVIDEKSYGKLKKIHYPFTEVEVDGIKGLSSIVTFHGYICDEEEFYKLLLIIESIISKRGVNCIRQVKEKYPNISYGFETCGDSDGYRIRLKKNGSYVTLKTRLLKAKRIDRSWKNHMISTENLPNSFVAIDFETLYPQRVSTCSVGMVKYKNGKADDSYYSIIRPPFDYPGKCGKALTWVHGFTEEMLYDAKTFKEILPEIEEFVDGLPLVAHNACVEKACIKDTCEYYGIETVLDFENILDTLQLSKQAEGKLEYSEAYTGSHQLDIVCQRFGIECGDHHNALADAEMCGDLMVTFQKVFEGTTIELHTTTGVSEPKTKYNPEDKIQRTDLENVKDNPFKEQVIVLTGFASCNSQKYAHKLNELGAAIKESVSKKTTLLITGPNAGPSKMQKAQDLGIRIMSEEEFKEILEQL